MSRNLARLTAVYVWQRLQSIDEELEHAIPQKAGRLIQQRQWWAAQLVNCQEREGYPPQAASLQLLGALEGER